MEGKKKKERKILTYSLLSSRLRGSTQQGEEGRGKIAAGVLYYSHQGGGGGKEGEGGEENLSLLREGEGGGGGGKG